MLREADILAPTPRNYRIETNWSQYAHAHHEADLAAAREVLGERYPHMTNAFDTVMRRTWGHRFNMLVMKREAFDAYCAWLFDMLFTLEARLDITAYDAYNRRVFGFLAERLLDVWLEGEGRACLEVPVCFMERQNWVRKAGRFLGRKVSSKK